jgi:Predicted nuclease of the RecB family
MATQIKAWQVANGALRPLNTTLEEQGRREAEHLEEWIVSTSEVLGEDLLLIGRQVQTRSGPLDLLAVDRAGNTVIIELKRGLVAREVLAQAIDYASDIASWTIERLSEGCQRYTGKALEEVFQDRFPDADMEVINVNGAQRILLVGFSFEPALERMVEWMSDNYDIGINAVLLRYSRTSSGDEMIMQTTVVPEEVVREKTKRQRKFQIPMSDEPGNYPMDELRSRWKRYLDGGSDTAKWIRQILLPACLQSAKVSRDIIKQRLVENHFADDLQKAGFQLSVISGQFGRAQNDFLRQVIGYEYPNNPWEKDNYHVRDGYREFAKELVQT